MYDLNFHMVQRTNPSEQPYDSWVLLICQGSGSKREEVVRSMSQPVAEALTEQNVYYGEITSRTGRRQAYKKFNFQRGKHPLFLVLNKHPLDYVKGDRLLVVEWGKWTDLEELKDDLVAFANLFSEDDFRNEIATAKDVGPWKRALKFLGTHGLTLLKAGMTIAAALA